MTKSWEKGDSPIVEHAKKEAARTGRDIAEILREMLVAAKQAKNKAQKREIQRAQKFLKIRNPKKRRRR